MRFKDFENKEDLIGKKVLYESGVSYGNKTRSIRTIERVTKTGFKITSMPNVMFDFLGHQKGLTGKMHMGTISRCMLISDEEAESLIQEWTQKKLERELRIRMADKVQKMTYEQLKKNGRIVNNLKQQNNGKDNNQVNTAIRR